MAQKFYAHPNHFLLHPNGAAAHYSYGPNFKNPYDSLGPYAKVRNCPVIIGGKEVARLTCYATGYADSAFSIPANTHHRGKYIKGYFTSGEGGVEFRVMDSHKHLFKEVV